jgi:cytochrome c oxidase assembly protein subunit 15
MLAMVILQGIFGAWTVTWKLLPQVVTSHLMGGFMTAGLLMLFLIRLYRMGRPVAVLQLARLSQVQLQMWIIIGLVLLVVQIFLGGWMSANYAAMACSDLPSCNGEWWPEQDFRQGFNLTQAMGPNYLGGLLDSNARKAIHITHRIGAVVLTVYMLYLGLLLWRNPDQRLRYLAYVTWALITLQFALGLANIYFYLPLPVAVAHNFGAACLFLLMLSLIYLTQSCRRPINE